MNKNALYYIYRIQYENLINDLDNFSLKINSVNISKGKILNELNRIIKTSYNKVYLIRETLKKEENNE